MLSIYQNIKKRRLELGLSQSELAKRMGYYDKSVISNIEHGRVDLPISKVLEFSKALNIDPRILLSTDGTVEGIYAEEGDK